MLRSGQKIGEMREFSIFGSVWLLNSVRKGSLLAITIEIGQYDSIYTPLLAKRPTRTPLIYPLPARTFGVEPRKRCANL